MTTSPSSPPSPSPASPILCADFSRQANSPLFGTASQVEVWLLLEYTRPWGKKATDDNELPFAVQTWLSTQTEAIPHSRLQFIRQNNSDSLTFFVAVASDTPRLYRLQLPSYEALLELDLAGMVAGSSKLDSLLQTEPIYLVCTNGKRDLSCAKYGRALYDAFDQLVGAHVWQTTHIGGHRFAGTAVVLPSGLTYGYLFAEDAAPLVEATRQNRIWLAKLRGRAMYTEPIQAAEYFLLGQHQAEFHLLHSTSPATDEWLITFADPANQSYTVHLRSQPSPAPVYKSTTDTDLTIVPEFHLIAIN